MATKKSPPRRPVKRKVKSAPRPAVSKQRRAQTAKKPGKAAKRPAKVTGKVVAKKAVKRRSIGPLTPYLTVADAAASVSFYFRAFGFKPGETMTNQDGRLIHAVMHYKGAVAIMFSPEGIWSGTMHAPAHSGAECPITMYVRCPKVDALTEQARAAGAAILTEPADMFWGDRIARIADPDGYVWCFATRVGRFDADKIPLIEEESADIELDIEF